MSGEDDKCLDSYLNPGLLAIIVVVVVASMVVAYLIASACVRAWTKSSPTYMYCSRCNQFLGTRNVSLPPHLIPSGPAYNFHEVPDVRVHDSQHDNRPPTGTFQRLGMRTSKSNQSSTFPNFLSPIQASPPDKTTTTSEMELLTPIPETHLPKYVNQPGSAPSSVKISKSSTPNDSSTTKRVPSLTNTDQFSRKDSPGATGASGRSVQTVISVQTVNTGLLSGVEEETACLSGDDSVFYELGEGGDCKHTREVSKMSQVRILASPPPVGAFKHSEALIAKTPANANKSHRNIESRSCQPDVSVPSKIINRIRSSLRDRDLVRRSVQSEGSGKSRRSLMSLKFNLMSEDRKPKNSKDTQYSPLINQNPTTTEDSCGMKSGWSEEDKPLITRTKLVPDEKFQHRIQMTAQGSGGHPNGGFIKEENKLIPDREKNFSGSKNTASEVKKRGTPGNTGGNVSINHLLVDIDINNHPTSFGFEGDPCKVDACTSYVEDPTSVSNQFIEQARTCNSDIEGPPASVNVEFRGEKCKVGTCSSPEPNDVGRMETDEKRDQNVTPIAQEVGTRPKIRSSSSVRKEKAKYLGKRPGFTESDITSQSEDERPRSRIASLRRSHLPGMSQSEEDETTSKKERAIFQGLETPTDSPQYPVQGSKYVTTKRGTPNTPSSLPITTPKFITVRGRDNAPDTSNFTPNSWDLKQEFPPNSWDPGSQEFAKNKPMDLSASSGQANISINSLINNNLSVTAMDNSTPAEGNHTSSPHSTAHLTSFKPEDLSIPGFDSSLQVSPNQDETRITISEMETSPPLVQDGRYGHPSNNPMRQPIPVDSNPEQKSTKVLIPESHNNNSHEMPGTCTEKLSSNNSPGGSNNLASPYDIRYPKDLLGNLDNSGGSFPSENQPLRLNHNSSKGSQDTSRGVSIDSTSTLVPSPVNLQTRPLSEVHTPVFTKSSPSPQHTLNPQPPKWNHLQSMPPASQWSRVQEHALPPSLPPPAPKTRIMDVYVLNNHHVESAQNTNNQQQRSLESCPSLPIAQTVMSKETASSGQTRPMPPGPMQPVRSLPPAPHWSRVKEHAPPPSLPPPAPKTRIPGFDFQHNRYHETRVVSEENDTPSAGSQNDPRAVASVMSVATGRVDSQPGGPGVPARVDSQPGGPGVHSHPGGPSIPARSKIPMSNRSTSVTGQANAVVEQIIRTRSTTESSQAPSMAWDSYGSDPSFVPRRADDLEDFTLSSTSETEADNNVRIEKQQMAYRSDGDYRYNRDVQGVGREQQNRPSRLEQIQASEFVRAGVRTRSQSQ